MPARLPRARLLNDPPRRSDTLVVVPVYNEMPHLGDVMLTIRLSWDGDVLAVDDHSTDGSADLLRMIETIHLLRHERNAGAGGVLLRGFRFAIERGYRSVITLDADGQHSPFLLKTFFRAIEPHCGDRCDCRPKADFVWGSRYLQGYRRLAPAFQARQEVNKTVTRRLNALTGYALTDAFCGFRAYRTEAIEALDLTETGYGMFMQMTLQAAHADLSIREIPVPLIYLDETRNFQDVFRDTRARLTYYHRVIDAELARLGSPPLADRAAPACAPS
jgi:dolichol-phosphate mannosyltransferase